MCVIIHFRYVHDVNYHRVSCSASDNISAMIKSVKSARAVNTIVHSLIFVLQPSLSEVVFHLQKGRLLIKIRKPHLDGSTDRQGPFTNSIV